MQKNIIIKGININYEETGDPKGFPVILLHGWGCNNSTLKSIATILEPSMHIFSLDLPGHGNSEEPSTIWGTSEFAETVEEFIRLLNIEKPSLIGHSFGGRTAIMMASRGIYNRLVLIDSAGITPKRTFLYYYKVYSFKVLKHLSRLLPAKIGTSLIDKLRSSRGSADYKNSSPIMRAVMSKCINEDLKKIMPKIKAPVLLIWGKDDTATPWSDAIAMEKLIPDSGLVGFDDCGHYSFLDNPYGFKAVLKEFFKKELSNEAL